MSMIFYASVGLAFAFGVFLVFLSLDRRPGAVADDHIEQRLKGYGEIEPVTIDEIELQKPFQERVLRPALERAGRFLSDRTPQRSRDALRAKLSIAGNPGNDIADIVRCAQKLPGLHEKLLVGVRELACGQTAIGKAQRSHVLNWR